MKKLKYIALILVAAFATYGCSEDPIDLRLSSSDFFVTFDTHNGNTKSLSITESDTTIVTVTIAATIGDPVTVTFDVVAPTVTNPASALYELLTMNNAPLTTKTLTFPQGTGSQSFKFVATDNDDIDGSRTFTIKLTGVSNSYRVGVNATGEGATLPIAVKDDEVVVTMAEFVGEWTVSEDQYFNDGSGYAWHNGIVYNVTITEINASTVKITGLSDDEELELTANVSLDQKVKTISIPRQQIIPTWNSSYDTYFIKLGDPVNPIAMNSIVDKADDGTITLTFAASATSAVYGIGAVNPGGNPSTGWLGYWFQTRGTKFVKEP
jgi:hypothetical protein